MGIRRWWHTVLKVVVMAVTMCSGIRVAQDDWLAGYQGYKRRRAIRQSRQDLDPAA